MWEQDIADTRERYRARYREHGYSPVTLGWNKDCRAVRFEAALEGLREHEYTSILDVGCGFADLLGYLRNRGWKGQYTGVDLVPELLQEARERYGCSTEAAFDCLDISGQSCQIKADMAVALGIFNHKVRQGNLEFIGTMLEAMWNCSARVVVCDFLSTSSEIERRKDNLYYADPRVIYEIASRYSRRIMIHHSYMPFEFQVKIWHDDSYAVEVPVFPPYCDLASRPNPVP